MGGAITAPEKDDDASDWTGARPPCLGILQCHRHKQCLEDSRLYERDLKDGGGRCGNAALRHLSFRHDWRASYPIYSKQLVFVSSTNV